MIANGGRGLETSVVAGGLRALMAESARHERIRAGIMLEQQARQEVAEEVRVPLDPAELGHGLLDLLAQPCRGLVRAGLCTRKQPRRVRLAQQEAVELDVAADERRGFPVRSAVIVTLFLTSLRGMRRSMPPSPRRIRVRPISRLATLLMRKPVIKKISTATAVCMSRARRMVGGPAWRT